jgi:hypothetical protein
MKINLLIKTCLILIFLISHLNAAVEKKIVKEIKCDDLVVKFYQNYDKNVKGDYRKKVNLSLEATSEKGEVLKTELKDEYYGGAFIYTNLKMVVEKISLDKYYVIFNIIFGGDGDQGHDKTLIFEYDRKNLKKIYDQYLHINEIKNENNEIKITGGRSFSQCYNCSLVEDAPDETLFTVPLEISVSSKGLKEKIPLNKNEKEKLLENFVKAYRNSIEKMNKSKNKNEIEYIKKFKKYNFDVESELRKTLNIGSDTSTPKQKP